MANHIIPAIKNVTTAEITRKYTFKINQSIMTKVLKESSFPTAEIVMTLYPKADKL